MGLNKEAIKLLDRLYKDLYLNDEVLHYGNGNQYDKFNNIENYLKRLESIHNEASNSDSQINYLKNCYYDKYVIKKEDIPESYYENQQQMALERGFGHIEITLQQREQLQDEVIENQKKSLDRWIDYFLSDDAKVYPFWAKYWAFQGMIKLGYFDKEKKLFYKRTKNTICPFCDLNREALSMSIDLLIKSLNKEFIEDKDLEILVKSGSFQKIYAYCLTKVLNNNTNITKKNVGKWVKYECGSDHMPLVNSLKGYNTGWCTAGEATAREQLSMGDFYVYYTLDDNDEYNVPRIAIRMEGGSIGEIRGIAENQNIEPEMEKIVEEKIKDFPDKNLYYKKVNDMKMLTEIYKKYNNNLALTKEELAFLYEIDSKIEGFGYDKDPRIDEIIRSRYKRRDLAYIFNCKEEQIAFELKELKNKYIIIIYYEGMIHLANPDLSDKRCLPKYINGNLDMTELKTDKKFVLPERINGGLFLDGLQNVEDSKLPDYIGGLLSIDNLKSARDLQLPKYVRSLDLESLIDAEGLVLPGRIDGDLFLSGLTDIKNLKLPKYIGGSLSLNGLKNAEGLVLPEYVGGTLNLKGLESAEGLVLPKNPRGLRLNNLKSAKGLILPEKLYGLLNLSSLTSSEELILPKKIGGRLDLSNLINIDELILPEEMGSNIDLKNLKSADRLVLPEKSEGNIYLKNFESIENLVLPEELMYTIYMKDFLITPDNVEKYRNKQNVKIKK